MTPPAPPGGHPRALAFCNWPRDHWPVGYNHPWFWLDPQRDTLIAALATGDDWNLRPEETW